MRSNCIWRSDECSLCISEVSRSIAKPISLSNLSICLTRENTKCVKTTPSKGGCVGGRSSVFDSGQIKYTNVQYPVSFITRKIQTFQPISTPPRFSSFMELLKLLFMPSHLCACLSPPHPTPTRFFFPLLLLLFSLSPTPYSTQTEITVEPVPYHTDQSPKDIFSLETSAMPEGNLSICTKGGICVHTALCT